MCVCLCVLFVHAAHVVHLLKIDENQGGRVQLGRHRLILGLEGQSQRTSLPFLLCLKAS